MRRELTSTKSGAPRKICDGNREGNRETTTTCRELTTSLPCVTLRRKNILVQIRKAVITAAGKNQRTLPLQTLVDRDGIQKTALAIIIEEILRADIEEICVVVSPGDEASYRNAAGKHASRLQFVDQAEPLGYGHAIQCAKHFTGAESFLLLVGDHLYISHLEKSCAQQLVEMARAENCSVSAVQATHESKLPYYGTVGGRLVPGRQRLYQIEKVIEKPTPTEAEQKLIVPGLRAGNYLCFFGMHVLTPSVMEILTELVSATNGKGVQLTDALTRMATKEPYLALELQGRRYDIGAKYGLLIAQLALSLDGKDRDEVLTQLVELLAVKKS
jgi:UTP--glucose-1-phosphate uridylyltransferase